MWFNPIEIWLLKSPLHFIVSKNMMLVNFTGRKSGNQYTVPVNYLQDGDSLFTTSWRDRTWWRNLRDGGVVSLRLRGKVVEATPEVTESDDGVAALLTTYFQLAPNMARYFEVGLDPKGQPLPDDIAVAAKTRIIVQFKT
jgi:deazaflavin-dependent oxidoreductase (nitroreductase family)